MWARYVGGMRQPWALKPTYATWRCTIAQACGNAASQRRSAVRRPSSAAVHRCTRPYMHSDPAQGTLGWVIIIPLPVNHAQRLPRGKRYARRARGGRPPAGLNARSQFVPQMLCTMAWLNLVQVAHACMHQSATQPARTCGRVEMYGEKVNGMRCNRTALLEWATPTHSPTPLWYEIELQTCSTCSCRTAACMRGPQNAGAVHACDARVGYVCAASKG